MSYIKNRPSLIIDLALSGTTLSQTDISQTLLVFREIIKKNKFRSLEYCQWKYVFLNMEFFTPKVAYQDVKISSKFKQVEKFYFELNGWASYKLPYTLIK